jgi:hypothetical protein
LRTLGDQPGRRIETQLVATVAETWRQSLAIGAFSVSGGLVA